MTTFPIFKIIVFCWMTYFLYLCKLFFDMASYKEIYKKLFTWRLHHISEQNYLLLLSVIVGVLSGLAAVVLKTVVHLSGRYVMSVVEHILQPAEATCSYFSPL